MEVNKIRLRWGTFSVLDHIDHARLIPEILSYDRLVFPCRRTAIGAVGNSEHGNQNF